MIFMKINYQNQISVIEILKLKKNEGPFLNNWMIFISNILKIRSNLRRHIRIFLKT